MLCAPLSLLSALCVVMGAVVARPQLQGEGEEEGVEGGEVTRGGLAVGEGDRRSVKFEGDDMDEEADKKQARGGARAAAARRVF